MVIKPSDLVVAWAHYVGGGLEIRGVIFNTTVPQLTADDHAMILKTLIATRDAAAVGNYKILEVSHVIYQIDWQRVVPATWEVIFEPRYSITGFGHLSHEKVLKLMVKLGVSLPKDVVIEAPYPFWLTPQVKSEDVSILDFVLPKEED